MEKNTHLPPLPPRPRPHEPHTPTIEKIGRPISTLISKLSPPPLEEESQKAAKVLRALCGSKPTNTKTIPQEIIHKAKGLAIFTVTRASGIATLAHGSGVLLARTHNGTWSSPSGILVNSLGLGVIAGVDVYQCILVINTLEALSRFETHGGRGRVSLGGDIGVCAGPWGVGWKGETTRGKEVYSYMRCKKGVYAGFQLDGTVISSRNDENARFYSERASVSQILRGEVGRWTVLHDVLKEIDARLLPSGDCFDEKIDGRQNRFPVIMEFDDRRGQTKGKDGVWRPQLQPHPRPTRLSKEEWKRGKVYSGVFDSEKEGVYGPQPHPQQESNPADMQEQLALDPKLVFMRGALNLPSVSSKEDLYGAHEKKDKSKALGSKVLARNDLDLSEKPRLSVIIPTEQTPLVVSAKRREDTKGFHDLTYRTSLSSSATQTKNKSKSKDKKQKEKKVEKKEEIVQEDDDGEWEDERLFYDLNSRRSLNNGSAREEWEDERLFYVEKPARRSGERDVGNERGFYTIAQLGQEEGRTRKEERKRNVVVSGARDGVWAKAERYA